jgi:hypothetical protein
MPPIQEGYDSGSGLSVAPSFPAPPTPGNLMVAFLLIRTDPDMGDLPQSGWTQAPIGGVRGGGQLYAYYRVAESGDPAVVTFSNLGATIHACYITEWAGVSGTLIDSAVIEDQAVVSTISVGPVTAPDPAGLAIGAFLDGGPGPMGGNTFADMVPIAPYVELVNTDTDGNTNPDGSNTNPSFVVAYDELTSSGDSTLSATHATGVFADGPWGGVLLLFGATAGPPPPPVSFEVCGPDGTGCVLFENALEKQARIDYNGVGAGAFVISRYDDQATAVNIAQGNIIKCTFPEIDPDPIFEFILEEGRFDLISSDEEGGEFLAFGGKGTLNLLGYSLLGHQWLDTTHPKLNFPSEGVWRWPTSTGATAAGILRRIIDESQLHTPPALVGITHGGSPAWSDTHDSLGNPFFEMDGEWEIPIGQKILTAALRLAQAGMFQLEMRPGFELWVYDEMGSDRTGDFGAGVVRFEKGINITTELSKQEHNEKFASRVLLKTKKGHLWVNATGTPPYVKEEFLDLSNSSGTSTQARAAARAMLRGVEETQGVLFEVTPTGPNGEENDEAGGWYYPGFIGTEHGKYWVGDLVTLHTGDDPETDFVDATVKVVALTLREDETGALAPPIVELNAQWRSGDPASVPPGSPVAEGGSGSGSGSGATNIPHVHTQYQVSIDDRWKQPVRVATTGNVAISTALNAGDSIDGVTLAAGDRVLVRAQTTTSQNGIYVAGPTPARADDFAEDDQVLGSLVYVVAGTTLGGKVYRLSNTAVPDVGTDALTWAEVGSAGIAGSAASIEFLIDGGGAVIAAGVKGYIEVPFACTISAVRLLADVSGSIVVDIWKDTYANYPPVNADSITASATPTISSAIKSQDTTLTGWTTAIAAGDILAFNVDSATSITKLTVSLTVTRS